MILSLTLMPVLASLILPRHIEEREPLMMRLAHRINTPLLRFSMNHKALVMSCAAAVMFIAFGLIAPNLGSEFIPRLSEGAIAISVVRLTGTPLDESIKYNTIIEQRVLEQFPDEVAHVWSRIGSAEIATDPMGIELTDIFLAAQAAQAVEEGDNSSGANGSATALFARYAGTEAGVPAADRNAAQRNDFRPADRYRGKIVRR